MTKARVSIEHAVLMALQDSEQQLAEAQRVAHVGSWEWDLTRDRITWSDELYRIFGLQVQELAPSYEEHLSHVHPDDRGELAASVERAMQLRERLESVYRVITPAGAVKWVRSLGEVTVDDEGNPVRLFGTTQDVTGEMAKLERRYRGVRAESGVEGRGAAPSAERTPVATQEREQLLVELRHGVAQRQFVLHYQPKVLLANDRVVGVEALVRWEHPSLGLVPPDRFIPLAEDSGVIVELGAWVLEESCRQAKRWQVRFPGRPPLVMSVNVSARQFQPELVAMVTDILARTGTGASRVCLELTESVVMSDVDSAIAILGQLKSLGVVLSIDDFGTGYSSLAYLRRFPIDELKIDRSFVDGLGRDPEDTAIVAGVVAMTHALELEVVAEGVETQEQLERLRVLGCEQAQGYYISRPLPAAALEEFLAREDSGFVGRDADTATDEGGYHGEVVVIADDSPEVLQLASASFSAAGFEVHQADNGRTALELAQTVSPGCVVLDVHMPYMDGLETCRALRSDRAMTGCTIVMLTANAEAADKVDAFSAGADDYIVKPFAPRDLVGRVRAAMRRRADQPASGGVARPSPVPSSN